MMHGILDRLLVGLALAASAAYLIGAMGPHALRARLFAAIEAIGARAPTGSRRRRLAGRIASAGVSARGGCGGCGDCGSTGAENRGKSAETHEIPITKIGKRGA